MKDFILIFVLIIAFGCRGNEQSKSNSENKNDNNNTLVATPNNDKAYSLLKKHCYICHLAPGDEMIAPPMVRVKEHYLPVYSKKEDFINAIVKWVKNPNEDDALMPGAVRKFECMPPQAHIPEDTVRLIASYIYDNELEMPRHFMRNHNGNRHNRRNQNAGNRNEKIKVSKVVLQTMDEVKKIMQEFSPQNIDDYNKLGKMIFDKSKIIVMDKSNKGEKWDILHDYFSGMEEDMHRLMATKDIEEAKTLKRRLSNKISKFDSRFY